MNAAQRPAQVREDCEVEGVGGTPCGSRTGGAVHWDVLEEQPAGLVDDVGKEAMLVMPGDAAIQGRQEYVLAEAGEEVVR